MNENRRDLKYTVYKFSPDLKTDDLNTECCLSKESGDDDILERVMAKSWTR